MQTVLPLCVLGRAGTEQKLQHADGAPRGSVVPGSNRAPHSKGLAFDVSQGQVR